MRNRLPIVLNLMFLLLFSCGGYGQDDGTFSEPNSVLLFGKEKTNLYVVTSTGKFELPNEAEVQAPAYFRIPSLAGTADRVVWSVEKEHHFVVGVYSLRDKSWKTYTEICFGGGGSAIFSPDGTKIAFVSATPSSPVDEVCPSRQTTLQILDIATGKITPLSCCGWRLGTRMSWSPDGRELAIQHLGQIAIVEADSGKAKIIGEGWDPPWSPKGDWIAYMDASRQKCLLVHPDGTGMKAVHDLGRSFTGRILIWGAVWSPDGGKLLLNELNDHQEFKVTMVDLVTGKASTESRNGLAIFDWKPQSDK
jgi:hypothetical protein